jgi:hypothetical protein
MQKWISSMGNCIGKNGFRKTDEFKEREETKAKETAKPFDPIKNAAQATKKKEITETSKSIVNDQSQHSDVGSSSDSRTIEDIPANFERIGGNTDLANAKVILLGETHVLQHYKDVVKFINNCAADGDIILAEGWEAGDEVNRVNFAHGCAARLGVLDKDYKITEKDMFLTKNVDVYGCDDIEANKQQHINAAKRNAARKRMQNDPYAAINTELHNELDMAFALYNYNSQYRDDKMQDTINKMRNKFPDKRFFVYVGKNHALNLLEKIKNQEYIAISPTYDPTEEDKKNHGIKLKEKAERYKRDRRE